MMLYVLLTCTREPDQGTASWLKQDVVTLEIHSMLLKMLPFTGKVG